MHFQVVSLFVSQFLDKSLVIHSGPIQNTKYILLKHIRNIYYQMYFSSFLLQCIFQLLPFPMHTFYFDIALCSGSFFYTERETHKFAFDFGVCSKTKLIFYGHAHLAKSG